MITIIFFILTAIYTFAFDLVYTFILMPIYSISNIILSTKITKSLHFIGRLFVIPIYYSGMLVDSVLKINQREAYRTTYKNRWKEYYDYLEYLNEISYFDLIFNSSNKYPKAVRLFQHLNILWYSLGLKPDLYPVK